LRGDPGLSDRVGLSRYDEALGQGSRRGACVGCESTAGKDVKVVCRPGCKVVPFSVTSGITPAANSALNPFDQVYACFGTAPFTPPPGRGNCIARRLIVSPYAAHRLRQPSGRTCPHWVRTLSGRVGLRSQSFFHEILRRLRLVLIYLLRFVTAPRYILPALRRGTWRCFCALHPGISLI